MPAGGDGAGRGDDVRAADRAIVPDRGLAIVVDPENVASEIAVEIAGAGEMPAIGDGAGRSDDVGTTDLAVVPDRRRAVVVDPVDVVMRVAVVDGTGDRCEHKIVRNEIGLGH